MNRDCYLVAWNLYKNSFIEPAGGIRERLRNNFVFTPFRLTRAKARSALRTGKFGEKWGPFRERVKQTVSIYVFI